MARKKILRAHELIIEDDNGKPRGGIKTDAVGNTALHFEDDNGETRLYAGICKNGTPRIGLQFAHGKGSIQLEANDALNSAGINIQGPSGRVQIMIGVAPNGLPALALFDPEGNVLFPPPLRKRGDDKGNDNDNNPFTFDWDSLLQP